LPGWFALPDANAHYIKDIADKDVLASGTSKNVRGLIALHYHFDRNAEIWWMGVDPDFHRQGIGSYLFDAAKLHVKERGCNRMAVQTLSPRSKDKFYENTRSFYETVGFKPFVEFDETKPNPMMWMFMDL
ncbi:MAG TPA: GNAT family N-acetyltransferase, partial [Alphaproteobacteria bacterium]|nr:GNAT family N-acetyltransferase [Alphaproteobacteria bacterium]